MKKIFILFLFPVIALAQNIRPSQITPGTTGETLQTVGGVTTWASPGSSGFVQLAPTASQTVTQPSGTTLGVNRLNGAIYLSPSSDLGAQINSAVTELGASGGVIYLPKGQSLPWSTTATIPYSSISLIGTGPLSTTINCTVAGDCLDLYPTYGASLGVASIVRGFSITGNGSVGQNIVHSQDMIGFHLSDLGIDGASESGGACLWMEDYHYWTERTKIDHVNFGYNCNIAMRFTNNVANTNTTGSFGYNDIQVSMNPNGAQRGFSFENDILLYNGTLTATVNKAGVGAVVMHWQDTAKATNEVLDLRAEENGSAGYFWDTSTDTSGELNFSGNVFSDSIANNTAGGTTPSFSLNGGWGSDYIAKSYSIGGIPYEIQVGPAFMIPSYASAGYLGGFGLNARYSYNNSQWQSIGDGVHNGGGAVLIDNTIGQISFYAFPNTGGTTQIISPLGNYVREALNSTEAFFAVPIVSSVPTGTAPLQVTSTTPVTNLTLSSSSQAQVFSASLTTTAATSDNLAITGVTASSHCSMGQTNASAATNFATTYISAKTTNQITVTHAATAGMTYDFICTAN